MMIGKFTLALLMVATICGTAYSSDKPCEDLRLAIEDLRQTFPDRYTRADEFLKRLDEVEKRIAAGGADAAAASADLSKPQRETLLANPLLAEFDQILLIRRDENGNKGGISPPSPPLGLPQNWQSNSSLGRNGWDNEIVLLEGVREDRAAVRRLYKPDRDVLVAETELHWDRKKLLFSSLDAKNAWQIYEIGIDGTGLRQVTPKGLTGDSFDACYLADDKIIFACTSRIDQCVPCTGGEDPIANLFRMNGDGGGIRRLCFDQDQNWTPAMTEQGTVFYTRWQYSDQSHYFPRSLMQMNPDGTNQREHYGSGSYWPTSLFYVRPIPGEPSRFVGIVSGHHGVPRMGELVLFDTQQGRRENVDHVGQAPGVMQRIPARGQIVPAKIADVLVDGSWPKFLHPFPLNGKYFLVSAQPKKDAPWGVYLVDVFDNMILLYQEPGKVMFEPVPVKARTRPPVIPDRANLNSPDATVYIVDIYQGPGLAGVPRGTVKELQIYTFSFPIRGGHRGHSPYSLGISGPWDIHVVLGRVPVEPDGSAKFTVPANTPISVQPLDSEGKAIQLMRSWLTAMPGENLSCVGCHEPQDTAPPAFMPSAFNRPPSQIKPWLGAARAFDFDREVQPLLDRRCVGCHDGSAAPAKPDLRRLPVDKAMVKATTLMNPEDFSLAYYNLQRYVYRHGPEGEMPVLMPMELHADCSELVQLLEKGHHGVVLSKAEWDVIITWIDLNAPYYGSWTRTAPGRKDKTLPARLEARRDATLQHALLKWDIDPLENTAAAKTEFVPPTKVDAQAAVAPKLDGWPMTPQRAAKAQADSRPTPLRTIRSGIGVELEMAWVPPGSYVMGGSGGAADERPMSIVRIERGFWMSTTEISNRQYRQFAPSHNSRVFSIAQMNRFPDQLRAALLMNDPQLPVARVRWSDAMAYCRWLGAQTGESFDLPTEAQWEWACRAGSDAQFLSAPAEQQKQIANCAGVLFGKFHDDMAFTHRLFDERWDDGTIATKIVSSGLANAWGMKNMHGNVAEWTRSMYKPYPYDEDDGRNDVKAEGKRVVRGGSFSDRPKRCTASYRLAYQPWQGVYNVGFRVICYDKAEESRMEAMEALQ